MGAGHRKEFACGIKKRYVTWAEASRTLKRMRRIDFIDNQELLKVYRCNHCPYFHIGHGTAK